MYAIVGPEDRGGLVHVSRSVREGGRPHPARNRQIARNLSRQDAQAQMVGQVSVEIRVRSLALPDIVFRLELPHHGLRRQDMATDGGSLHAQAQLVASACAFLSDRLHALTDLQLVVRGQQQRMLNLGVRQPLLRGTWLQRGDELVQAQG